MSNCPICGTESRRKVEVYHACDYCGAWFQHPPPPKLFHGPEEPPITDVDRTANAALAKWLYSTVLKKPSRTLDIGCKEPLLAHELRQLGCVATAIDAIKPDEVPGVQSFECDIEASDLEGTYDLITMVHVFEHFYDPLAVLRKLRKMLNKGGRVYIRMPDHMVRGYERDLTAHHYTIHPFFFALASVLEMCVQLKDQFVVEWSTQIEPGQTDLILAPIVRAPRLGVAMIVKNEERDLARCMKSLESMVDHFSVVDTGSTDRTLEIAKTCVSKPVITETYLGASEQDDAGDWKLWHFSEARNYALESVEASGVDWVMWADGDDEFLCPQSVRRAIYNTQCSVYAMWIVTGDGAQWIHHRLWRTQRNVRFEGRCHEYATIGDLPCGRLDDCKIRHHAEPTPGEENSNPRNLRILLREWGEKQTPRTAFYTANTYRDAGRHAEAVEWYQRRIDFGVGFRDEWLFSRLYMARSLRALSRHEEADAVTQESLRYAPSWAEFMMDMSWGAYHRQRYQEAIAFAERVPIDPEIPFTDLWREYPQYRDQPKRMVSWCKEFMGDLPSALMAARLVGAMLPNDKEWNARIARLVAACAPVIVDSKPFVALARPGAIGDVLMTLNLIPALRAQGLQIRYFTSVQGLESVMLEAGVDAVHSYEELEQWAPLAKQVHYLTGYPLHEGYPEKPMRRHLLDYFAAELGVVRADGLVLSRPPRPAFAPTGEYVTLQMEAGWSAYKQYPLARWAAVCAALGPRVPIVPINKKDGHSLREIVALVANARMHLGIDSFANHLTHYRWRDETGIHRTRGVILWGSTQESAAGYEHNVNIAKQLPCRPCFRENPAISRMPRAPCQVGSKVYGDELHQCMQDISVDEVVQAVRTMWREEVGRAKYRVFGAAAAA
jgi:ADP-heptose:LPS heptosyltransferase/glycosyltransferase involved in cell wall biosynthesis